MQAAYRTQTTILPGHRIEITAPELPEGDTVEVIVVLAPKPNAKGQSGLESIESLKGHRLFQTPEHVAKPSEQKGSSCGRTGYGRWTWARCTPTRRYSSSKVSCRRAQSSA